MPAPKGNRFWEARAKHGRNKIFTDPQILWESCIEYFQWVEDNPLYETKAWCQQGEVVIEPLPKMRAMTIAGLCLFLDICEKTWFNYKEDKDFLHVMEKAEKIIYTQKFSGAAADLLNPNIIARDLGLRDAVDKQVTGPNGGPQVHMIAATEDPKEASRLYKEMMNQS